MWELATITKRSQLAGIQTKSYWKTPNIVKASVTSREQYINQLIAVKLDPDEWVKHPGNSSVDQIKWMRPSPVHFP